MLPKSVPNYKNHILSKYVVEDRVELMISVNPQIYERLLRKTDYINEILKSAGKAPAASVEKIVEDVISEGLDADALFLKYETTNKLPAGLTPGAGEPPRPRTNKPKEKDADNPLDQSLDAALGGGAK